MKNRFERKTGLFGRLLRFAALVPVLCAGQAQAVFSEADVPESLKPWTNWVLHGQEAWFCPEVAGRRDKSFCAWPGELKLDVRQGDMQFSQNWELQMEGAVPLPGNRKYWPQRVTVNGRAYPVQDRNGEPLVWLPPGRHTVSGGIQWMERPQALKIPENVALISLTVDGKAVLPLKRQAGALVLGKGGDEAGTPVREGDSFDLQVYRKLIDGIPARLVTRMNFKVSGKARELSVPDVLPPHFVPVRLASPWTARLDQDGRLLVQAASGQATVEIEARLRRDEPLKNIEPGLPAERPQEVWSYEANPALRSTVVSPKGDGKVIAVDPQRAEVPHDWRGLPAFAVNKGGSIEVTERSRGQGGLENRGLTLQREMWLDFSGDGFFARDRIAGVMQKDWRFDVAKPYRLERADGGQQQTALLVTYGADETLTGVEWRQSGVMLNAGVRLDSGVLGRVPVTGWRQSFDSVETTLHLPYGYRLIAAPGVDRVSDNVWVERWTIQHVFLAAFLVLLAWRLLGGTAALAVAAYLALAMQEPGAPLASLAAVVVLALLCRVLPEGRPRKWFLLGERIALACFVAAAVVFIPAQIRCALYPQLENVVDDDHAEADAPVPAATAPVASEASRQAWDSRALEARVSRRAHLVEAESDTVSEDVEMSPEVLAKTIEPLADLPPLPAGEGTPAYMRYSQSTVTQTGDGEPAWELGQQYRLHWSGPVAEAQSVRLLVSPPWLTRLLRVLSVALLGWLAWRLVRVAFPSVTVPPAWFGFRRAAPSTAALAAGLAVLFAAGLGFPVPAAAQQGGAVPPREMLDELKKRLLEPPECAPHCIDVADVRIDAGADILRVVLTAHVEAATSLALPVPDGHLDLRNVRVNGKVRPALRLNNANYVALSRGIHHVQLEYAVSGDAVSLGFPIRPARVEFGSAHWQVEGIDENRLLSGALNFSRALTDVMVDRREDASGAAAPQQFPPFVHVSRHFDFDLDWSVHTRVQRVAPTEGGFTFSIPLLGGEHVTTPETKVQDGHAVAVFAEKTGATGWTSRLDKRQSIELVAPPSLSDRAESWHVNVGPSWHLEWNGVPVNLAGKGFVFHPLPGEKLVLTLTQPEKTEGSTRAIDRVQLESRVGQRAREVTLAFQLRASQGGDHRIRLPEGLEVLEVKRDGMSLDLQPRDDLLSLPVQAGSQTYTLRLRQQAGIGFFISSPKINLGLPAANVDLRTVLEEDRWILHAGGPAAGPAVLYWIELAAALFLAFLLARSKLSSIGRGPWFLLVLGFSMFSWITLLVVVSWLIVIDWRVRANACANWPALRFNAMQAGIVALTAVMLAWIAYQVPAGLAGVPDMGISGYGSGNGQLNWFADRSDAALPVTSVFSAPIWGYRLLMLAWTLWLVYILICWLRRGLSAWLGQGCWRKID